MNKMRVFHIGRRMKKRIAATNTPSIVLAYRPKALFYDCRKGKDVTEADIGKNHIIELVDEEELRI